MKLGNIMTRFVVTVAMNDDIRRIRSIFEESRFHHLVVTDKGRVAGLISDRDVLKALSPFVGQVCMERRLDINTLGKRAHQIMRRDLVVGHADMDVEDAIELVLRESVTCLPVVTADGRLDGMITWRDLLRQYRPPAARHRAAS